MDSITTRAVFLGLLANIAGFLAKLVGALVTQSASLFSEALHSLADSVNSIFLLIGLKLASRPADRKHPFGYGMEVFFWSFMACMFMLGFTSMGAILKGYSQIISPTRIIDPYIGIYILLVTIIVEVIAVHYASGAIIFETTQLKGGLWKIFSAARKLRSATPTSKFIFVEDIIALTGATLALIALLTAEYIGAWIDGVMAVAIGLLLGILAILMANENREMLLGRSAPPLIERKIREVVLKSSYIRDVRELKTLYIGPKSIFAHLELELDPKMPIEKADDVIAEVERKIKSDVKEVKYCSIEVLADES